jgi:alpha-L-rhamnosidase
MSDALKIAHLICEYRSNPLGIDILQPRLSWQLQSESAQRGARQTAYQILAASSGDFLEKDQGDLWDTGKVTSDQSVHVVYGGKPLVSRQRIWWKVRAWNEDDRPSDYSSPAWWEMGLLQRHDWTAQWISAPLAGGPRTSSPAPFFRKPFEMSKRVASARLYITALGVYEAYINGTRVSEDIFNPGWTEYKKRVVYHTYDVTALLRSGENTLGAIVGDGWYCGFVGWLDRQNYGDRPRLLAQLLVDFEDGSTEIIGSESTWKANYGPILESDMLMGESYDARREAEFSGWSGPGFDDSRWLTVEEFPNPAIELNAACTPPVRRIEELHPIADPGQVPGRHGPRWIFDLGQNMVGIVRLKITGPAGTTITLRYAEVLNPDGTLYTENLRAAKQTDLYTLRGGAEETYEQHFTFHGFRYVEVGGYLGTPARDTITGVVLHSDLPQIGTFECSDPLINQLQHNILWGQKGNFLDVPTDCPQRDERLGWTGDAQVFVRTATFNLNVASFFTKWQQDLADAQHETGYFPKVAPDIRYEDGGPAWADAGVICPWTIYLSYGDQRLLNNHYQSMRRFVDHLKETSIGLIRSHPDSQIPSGYGDWLSTNADTPKDLIGTAFFAYCTRLLSQIATVIGNTDDAEKYAHLFADIQQAFLDRFVSPGGIIVGQTQTAYVLALHFDLLPEALRPAAIAALVRDIETRDMHLSTGFVGTPYLMHVLSRFGRLDIAYALLEQKTFPSWLYPVTQGATTIWERWDGWRHDKGFQDPRMNSFNHYAYGAIGDWLYRVAAGIEVDPAQPGYKHIILNPHPGGSLTTARASLESLYGPIVSDWRAENGVFDWHITVPPNTTATAYIPATASSRVTEGGKPAHEASGITVLEQLDSRIVYRVAPGEYHFKSIQNGSS